MFLWVAKVLADRGFDVTILTYKKNLSEDVPLNVKWIQMNLERSNFFRSVRTLRKCIKELKPECVISFLLDANVLNTLACLGLKTKSVICERSDPFKPRYYKLKILRPLFRLAKGGVFQLPKVAEFYSNINAPVAVIPNPVIKPAIRVASFDNRSDVVVTVGRIDTEQKRHDVLIRAFSIFSKKNPDYCLHIYGNGHNPKDVDSIKLLIKQLNLESKIILKGVTDSPQDVIKKAKFFVLTSDFEGIPNSLIEAMSIGLPCISTDCRPGGAAFLINDGVNGLLVPCGNEEMIAEKMHFLANNSSDADRIGLAATGIAETYSEDKVAGLWDKYLRDLCNVSD